MNLKTILVFVAISFIAIFSVSYIHAQTVSFGSSNATSTSTFGFNNTPSFNSTICNDSQLDNQMHAQSHLLDTTRAKFLASDNSEFKSETQRYISDFNSIFGTWSWDNGCRVTLQTINVVYSLNDTKGFVRDMIISEDAAMTKVINITLTKPIYANPSANWSGYEMRAASVPRTVPVYEAKASWVVPAISSPPEGCSSTPCNLVIWPGLTSYAGGPKPTGIVQAGSGSDINRTGTFYYMWYEFYPATNIIPCLGITATDNVQTNVYNAAILGGNATHYYITNKDLSRNTACTTITDYPYPQLGTPYYAEFINEKATLTNSTGNFTETLPKFSSDTMTGTMNDTSNNYRSISVSYNNGWYTAYTLINSNGGFINFGSASSGSFNSTWYPNCIPPSSGNWVISSSCALKGPVYTNGNVILSSPTSGSNLLLVPNGTNLNIGLQAYNLYVGHAAGVLIKAGAKVS